MFLIPAYDSIHRTQLRTHDPNQIVQITQYVHAEKSRADRQDVEIKLKEKKNNVFRYSNPIIHICIVLLVIERVPELYFSI